MLDLSSKWQPEPDWAHAHLVGSTIAVRTACGITQRLVSGEIGHFLARYDLDSDVGALGLAVGKRYAVRLARDRLLIVGVSAAEVPDGRQEDGFAISTVSSGLHVFEVEGEGSRDLLARATTIDPDNPGPCAALSFAGVMGTVYRHDKYETLRIHVDQGLAPYLWEWFECQPLFLQG